MAFHRSLVNGKLVRMNYVLCSFTKQCAAVNAAPIQNLFAGALLDQTLDVTLVKTLPSPVVQLIERADVSVRNLTSAQ